MITDSGKFAGHQSFPFRNTWLTKGVSQCADDAAFFRRPDALVILGVGKNMVESIRHWCLATRVIEQHPDERYSYQPSRIGHAIFVKDGGWDPYLEDEGSLWLLHYLLATHAEAATTVYFAFNEWPGPDFTSVTLYQALFKYAQRLQCRVTPGTLKRDINVFTRSYVGGRVGPASSFEDTLDCPLTDLKLVYEDPIRQTCEFARGPKDSLPDAVFYFALQHYAQRQGARKSFTFDELAYFPLSPGRVFKLDEPALAERLERLSPLTGGAWQIADTAGYRQMIARQSVDAYDIALHRRVWWQGRRPFHPLRLGEVRRPALNGHLRSIAVGGVAPRPSCAENRLFWSRLAKRKGSRGEGPPNWWLHGPRTNPRRLPMGAARCVTVSSYGGWPRRSCLPPDRREDETTGCSACQGCRESATVAVQRPRRYRL